MSAAPEDARLAEFLANSIPALAQLYDRFANALDPYAPERDQAEQAFQQEIAGLYDHWLTSEGKRGTHLVLSHNPDTFRRMIILLCRRHLKATDHPSSLPP